MALYLVQHGKALAEQVDAQRSLSEAGTADVERIARVASEYGVRVSVIEHSGKKRALQTAQIFAAALNPPDGIKARDGINPLDDVATVAQQMKASGNVMLVGHLPFMQKLASYLITGSDEVRVIKFQNGGIVCLDQENQTEPWFIKWALMPEIG